VGAPGVGKTRLAIEAAARRLDSYSGGAWWVELGNLADPLLIPEKIAVALEVGEVPGRALIDTLAAALTASPTSSATASGTLGTVDPTPLLNGIYELQLTVTDVSGRTSTAATTFVVEGNQKIGIFSLSYVDLAVPLVGLPIQITRTYDSRDKRAEDFGVGWSLGISNVRLQENRPLGAAWTGTRSFVNFCVEPAAPHIISITLPDNSVHQFEARARVSTNNCQGLGAPDEVSFVFTPRGGTAPLEQLAIAGQNHSCAGRWPVPRTDRSTRLRHCRHVRSRALSAHDARWTGICNRPQPRPPDADRSERQCPYRDRHHLVGRRRGGLPA
jgi:hypothetical protein